MHLLPHRHGHRTRPIPQSRERGAVLPITALVLTLLMTATAFTIDLGRLRSERRNLQADADAIALDAASVIGGLSAFAAHPLAITEANASAQRNGLDATLTGTEVQVGEWDVDTQTFTQMTGATEFPNAVQVDLSSAVPMYFDFSTEDRSVSRTGVAVVRAQTRGSIGSVFSGIQAYDATDSCAVKAAAEAQMSFMNAIYTQFLNINVSGGIGAGAEYGTSCDVTGPTDGLQLDAASWQGLAFGQVSLRDVATDLGFASVDELMSSQVNARDFYEASANAMNGSGDAADVTAGGVLASFASDVDGSFDINMLDLASAASGPNACTDPDGNAAPCAADTEVNALGLLTATAQAIDGNNFVDAELPVSLPFTGSTITPVIRIIEPPQVDVQWRNATESGPSTSQIRLAFDVPLTDVEVDFGSDLGGVLAPLGVQLADGNIGVVVEVAAADTTHEVVQCSADTTQQPHLSTMRAETGAVTVSIGAVADRAQDFEAATPGGEVEVESSSLLEGTFGVTVLGVGINLDLTATSDVEQTYTYDGINAFSGGYDSTVGSNLDVNGLGNSESHTFEVLGENTPSDSYRYQGGISGTSITDHSHSSLSYNTTSGLLSSLGVANAAVTNLISSAIEPTTDELGPEVIDPLLAALGVTVGGGDGQILGVRCQVPALANRG